MALAQVAVSQGSVTGLKRAIAEVNLALDELRGQPQTPEVSYLAGQLRLARGFLNTVVMRLESTRGKVAP